MANKKSREEKIRRGIEELQKSAVPVNDSSPAVVARLREHLGKGRATDLAILFVLGRIVDRAAAVALTAIEKESNDKEIKKEVRRSLFKLAQRGIEIPKDAKAETQASVPLFSRESDVEAYMSAVDGAGGRLVWMAKPHPGHGLQVIQGMVSDREGLQRVGGAQIRRKELRKMTQDIKKNHGVTMISIPWEYADEILYEGFETAKARGRGDPENFLEMRAMINSGRPKKQEHPIYSRINSDDVREGAWRDLSRRLLDEAEFRFWILDDDWVRSYVAQLQEAQTSRLVLNPIQKEERFAAIVREAVETLFSEEKGKLLRRRLEDMALYFIETDREQPAKLALAVALQVGEGDPGPLDISFLTGLVQKSFAYHTSQEKAKAEEEPSLIVRP